MACSICGGKFIGDGYRTALHCENAEEKDYWHAEPDANPIECKPLNETQTQTHEKENH